MSKTRVVAVLALVGCAGSRRGVWRAAPPPSRRSRSSEATVKLGFITKFPVDFFFVLQNAAKKWDKAHKDATVIFAQGKSATDDAGEIAAIQDMVAKGVKGIAITPTSPAVSKELDKAIKKGVKVVLMDNDIPAWKKKTSVVATNNRQGRRPRREVPVHQAEGRRHARNPRGRTGRSGPRRPRQRHAGRSRCAAKQDQGRLEARDRLRSRQGPHCCSGHLDREPERHRHLRRVWAAGAGRGCRS